MITRDALIRTADLLAEAYEEITGLFLLVEGELLYAAAERGYDDFIEAARQIFGTHMGIVFLTAASQEQSIHKFEYENDLSRQNYDSEGGIWLNALEREQQVWQVLQRASQDFFPEHEQAIQADVRSAAYYAAKCAARLKKRMKK